MAVAIDAGVIAAAEDVYATIETQGRDTRGQVVIDWRGKLLKTPNIRVVTKMDRKLFKRLIMKVVL